MRNNTGLIILILLATCLPTSVAAQSASDVEDLGELDDSVVELDMPSDLYIYHRVYVASGSDISQDGEIKEWEDVEIDASLRSPSQVWDLNLGDKPVLFRDSGEVDLSEFGSGEYYIFPWGCETRGLSGGNTVPGECRWLKPYRAEIGQEPDIMISGHRGAGENGKGLAPENTIKAFKVANEIGVDQVEFDIKAAKDGYVVFHDGNTGRLTDVAWNVKDTSVDKLTDLTPDKGYTEVDSDYAISEEEAADTHIPELGEALDYIQGTDLHMRLELKGRIAGKPKMAREIYNMVESRGMTDRTIFMALEGDCDISESNSLFGKVKDAAKDLLNLDTTRSCTYPALEAIEEESGGDAQTAVLWQTRNVPARYGGATNLVKLPIWNALNEAEENNFDMVVPRVQDHYGHEDIGEVGLADTELNREEFIEEAESRGLDYAFMAFDGGRIEQFEAEPVWVSGNRPDKLKERYEDYLEEQSGR